MGRQESHVLLPAGSPPAAGISLQRPSQFLAWRQGRGEARGGGVRGSKGRRGEGLD